MERKIFHGNIQPADVAQALLGAFNQGNLRAQTFGQSDKMIVQIGTKPGAASGGQTAITVTVQKWEDGVIVELGQQAWLGVAASLGASAIAALKNPFSLLGRLDDIAQDIESLQISERVWQVVAQTAKAAGVSTELSERLKRAACEYCGTANLVGAPSCVACGAPMGKAQPNACPYCGYIYQPGNKVCPHCKQPLR